MLPLKKLICSKSVWILFICLTSTTFGFLENLSRNDISRRSIRGSRSSVESVVEEMPFRKDTRRQINEKDRLYENLYDRRSFRTGTDRFRNRNIDIRLDRRNQNWNDERRALNDRVFLTPVPDITIPTRGVPNERRSRDVRLNREQPVRSQDNRSEGLFRDDRRSRDTRENEVQRERREETFTENRMRNIRETQPRSLNTREERMVRETLSRENRQQDQHIRQLRTRNNRQRELRTNDDSRLQNRDQRVERNIRTNQERINERRQLQERREESQDERRQLQERRNESQRNHREQSRERMLKSRNEYLSPSRYEQNLRNSERRIENRERNVENRERRQENEERIREETFRYNRDNTLEKNRQIRSLNGRQERRTAFEAIMDARESRTLSTRRFRDTQERNIERRVANNRDSNERSLERRDVRSVRSSRIRNNRSNGLDVNMNEIRQSRERHINIRSEDRSDLYREREERNQRERQFSREHRYMDRSTYARRVGESRYRYDNAYSRSFNMPSRSVRDLPIRASLARRDSARQATEARLNSGISGRETVRDLPQRASLARSDYARQAREARLNSGISGRETVRDLPQRVSLARSDSTRQAREARLNSGDSRQETSTCTSVQRDINRQISIQRNTRENDVRPKEQARDAVSRSSNSIERRSVPVVEFVPNSRRYGEELKDIPYHKHNMKFDALANVIQVILGVYLIGQILAHSSKKKSYGLYKMLPSLSAIKEKLE